MERGHGGEHVGVAGVEAVEYAEPGHGVERVETCHVAAGAEHEVEAMFGHIPWRSGGMNVIEREPDEVDQQEHQREMQILHLLAAEVEPKAEKYRQGHPTEIEHSGEKVGQCRCVLCEKFVGGECHACGRHDAKEAFLGLV